MNSIRQKEFLSCIICSAAGEKLYEGIPDRCHSTSGTFNFRKCASCGLLWLDPMPVEEDLVKCYDDFFVPRDSPFSRSGSGISYFSKFKSNLKRNIVYAHYGYSHFTKNKLRWFLSFILGHLPLLLSRAEYGINGFVPFYQPGKNGLIIDVGCGTGDYLRVIREMGWQVMGIEPSSVAAALARKKGLTIFEGVLSKAKIPESSAEYITFNHVIEHDLHPFSDIEECFRILKPGGKLIIRTPNAQSLGHELFGDGHYSLDPPRHLFLFSPGSMRRLLEKSRFKEFKITTRTTSSRTIYDNNIMIKKTGGTKRTGITPQRGRLWFAFRESFLWHLNKDCGEELEVVATKS